MQLLVALALGGLSACTTGNGGEETAATTTTTSSEKTKTTSAEGTTYVEPRPNSIIAGTKTGEVDELTPEGDVRRVLLDPTVTGGPPGHLAISANGRAIYFDRGRQGCWEEFSFTGDDPAAVAATGAWPTPSPDGHWVAVVRGADPCSPDRIALLGQGGASAHEWVLPRGAGSVGGPLSWSSDSRRLSYVVRNSDQTRVEILNTDTGNELRGTSVAPTNQSSSVVAAFFFDTNEGEGLTVLEAGRNGTTMTWMLVRRSAAGDVIARSAEIPEPRDLSVTRAGAVAIVTVDERLLAGSGLDIKQIGKGFVAVALPLGR